GRYTLVLEVLYRNDALRAAGPLEVMIDRIPPQATVKFERTIFSPNNDGRNDTLPILQESVPGDRWQAQIVNEQGTIVRTWEWADALRSFEWDGMGRDSKTVPDGTYFYELRSMDEAGNSFVLPRQRIVVDAARKVVALRVDPAAFSPNDDGVKDVCFLNVTAPRPETLVSFRVAVYQGPRIDPQAVPVRSWTGTTQLASQYRWDGKSDAGILLPDGVYTARLELQYANGDIFDMAAGPLMIDTVPPKIKVSAEHLLFSPNGDGNRDTLPILQQSEPGDDWVGRIKDAAGTVVRSWTWKQQAANFSWDGKDASGRMARDGVYTYEVVSVDAAGNSAAATIKGITLDTTKPKVYVSASDTGISPNGDGIRDEVSFALTVEQRDAVESWRFSLLDQQGVERSFFGGTGSDVPPRLVWDGRDLQGQVIQGTYTGRLAVRYLKGDVVSASSAPVLVDIEPPRVEISVTPEYFSPDGDGIDDTLRFSIQVDKDAGIKEWSLEILEVAVVESSGTADQKPQRSFKTWSDKGTPPAQIVWNGRSSSNELVESATDYPFVFTSIDGLGNKTTVKGVIAVDVLVLKEGDKLKIKVPSIVFRANHADFIGLDAETVARNQRVIARIAQILNKFPDYRIRIEGHGNNIGKMLGYSQARIQQEEINELIPLSTARAEKVRAMLIENGVDARRLSVVGLGSSEPVVKFTDVENRWKNRRVEFVLIRNQ
ncbi:MAG: gliding motility-associated C-terminal domain-containing protein, partial [Spirochaetales bacterium]|nr:gliding motility-associated C-terminal domain-containing protein [Spirochaetales bacterium]